MPEKVTARLGSVIYFAQWHHDFAIHFENMGNHYTSDKLTREQLVILRNQINELLAKNE